MNEERLNKLLEDIDSALYDLKICQCNINVTTKGHKWETYYGLDDDLIKYIRKIESSNKNLQSKIDNAIEYAKDNLPERDYMGCLLTDEDVTLNMILEKLLDILKEDK